MEIKTSNFNTIKTINEIIEKDNTFKKDITLNVNEFNKLSFYNDRLSLARMLQNIVITKPGTYPNNPDFGCGIENYIFEFANNNTIAEITTSIGKQIDKWINPAKNNIHINVNVKYIDLGNPNYKNLAIIFEVTREIINNNENKNDNIDIYTLYVTGNVKDHTIISKLEL